VTEPKTAVPKTALSVCHVKLFEDEPFPGNGKIGVFKFILRNIVLDIIPYLCCM
jgi:hypothetical protein